MGISAAHAAAFFREVSASGLVWTIQDSAGFPAPLDEQGRRSMPFWSTASRAERVIATVTAYAGFETVSLSATDWRQRWLPGLRSDGLLVGINWSGDRATGYDLQPEQVLDRFHALDGPS
jgi:hypothetical protein